MYFRTLGFMLLIVTQVNFAYGRKPAVEDFVGIEVDHPEGTPQGTEGLFNFEQDMDKYEIKKIEPVQIPKTFVDVQSEGPSALTTTLAILFIIGLPGMIWFMMMNHLRQKAQIESASNIEVLEKYRQERELVRSQKKDNNIKKAS